MTVFDLVDSRADARERAQSARPRATAAQNFHAAVSLHQHGRLREAEQLYRALLNVNESDFDCLHNLGLLHAQEGRFDDAVGLLRAGARQDPRSVEVHNNLANVLSMLKRHDEAVAGFRIAIALQPDFAEAHNNLGNALATQGRTDEAVAHYVQALALQPDYADPHVNLGNILSQQGRLEEAIAHYQQALAIGPGVPETHLRLGDALKKLDRAGKPPRGTGGRLRFDPTWWRRIAGSEPRCSISATSRPPQPAMSGPRRSRRARPRRGSGSAIYSTRPGAMTRRLPPC